MSATDFEGEPVHDRDPESPDRTQLQILDVSRAYFDAATDDQNPTYVELPPEDPDLGTGVCGHLLVHLYGTRRAAEGWHTEYSDFLVYDLGFEKGHASACVFRHPGKRIVTGRKSSLDWLKPSMEKRYELTENVIN